MSGVITFPKGFLWGAATSAYQIEGAWNLEGKGPSIWDTFVHTPGHIYLNQTGDTAADHYHRWQEDILLMKEVGLKAYRFSIAWPRVLPQGHGTPNPVGLDFYSKLIDGLLEAGIEPVVTLYHCDLPQTLQDAGGWPLRVTAQHFADYAQLMAKHFSDRVHTWITLNEPMVTAANGHLLGEHAPGLRDIQATIATVHHLLLGHGLAAKALRSEARSPLQVGITLNLSPIHPASPNEEDVTAAQTADAFVNRATLDPLFTGKYPDEVFNLIHYLLPTIEPDDYGIISTPLDFLGINYYTRAVIGFNPGVPFVQFAEVRPQDSHYSQMWEIYPSGIYELLKRVWIDYRPKRILITENGVPVADGPDLDGEVRDIRRIQYLQDHLVYVHKAIAEGVPVGGYFVWTLMDNFEWALGTRTRFGLVYTDFETQQRTIKASGRWYKNVTEANGFSPIIYAREV